MRRHRGPWAITFARPHGTSEPPAHTRTRASEQTHVSSRFARASHRAFRAIRVPRAATLRVGSFPRPASDTAVMRVASFPGGEAALAFGACPRRPRRARVSRSTEARRPSTSPRARRTTNPSPRLRELKQRHICAPASRWRSTCSSTTPRRPRTWRMSRRWTRSTVTPRTMRTIPSASTSGTRRADPPERPTPLQACALRSLESVERTDASFRVFGL